MVRVGRSGQASGFPPWVRPFRLLDPWKADYVLAVKSNQDSLHKAVQAAFAQLDADPEAPIGAK